MPMFLTHDVNGALLSTASFAARRRRQPSLNMAMPQKCLIRIIKLQSCWEYIERYSFTNFA